MSNSSLSVKAISTAIFPQGGDLLEFLFEHLQEQELEGKVLAVTSKIVSLWENCVVEKESITKSALIQQEADRYLGPTLHGAELTIKHGIFIPSAGIDESNSAGGQYILYPRDPYKSAEKIWSSLRQRLSVKHFGLILTDSHTMPLRRGVTGIALSHWGFRATKSCIGAPDLFGRELKFTHVDLVDALACSAVLMMGEGSESSPLAVISAPGLEFTESSSLAEIAIPPENDLYLSQWDLQKRSK